MLYGVQKIKLNKDHFTLVDDELFEALNKFHWRLATMGIHTKSKYAIANKDKKTIYMHRVIMKASKNQSVDHINRNGLDNQKNNLRFASSQQNSHNRIGWDISRKTSKYKGVHWFQSQKRWKATINNNGKNIFIGIFRNELDAAKARKEKERELYKDFQIKTNK